jgi:hypothetical protein
MSAREVTFADNGDSVIASIAGAVQGATWGPAADSSGEWFVLAAGEPAACRVADKAAGVAELSRRLGGAS